MMDMGITRNKGNLMAADALDQAVADFAAHLSHERRVELASLFINAHGSWRWYAEVIDRYVLRDPSSAVIVAMNARYPDAEFFRMVQSDFTGPVWEAGVILELAKELVRTH